MMSPLVSATGGAMLLLLGGAGAHMVMNSPVPYNLDIQPLLQVDPISGGHYPFPCHNQYGFTTRTPVEAGGATLVNFTGGGQHGGGSCQFSITYDEPVDGGDWNKSATFKTIYSIIGGCPAVFTDETHNLAPAAMDKNMRQDGKHCGDDSGVDCIRQFMVPVPKFLKNGPATFAWTWFNKLGNKEMNCAPINITGGTGDDKQIQDLPNIFIANYPNDPEVPNCITGTSADKVVVNFPNPGKYGRVLQAPVEPVNKPSGYCAQIPPALSVPIFEPDLTSANTPIAQDTATLTLPVEKSTSAAAQVMMPTNIPITDSPTTRPPMTKTPPPMVLPTTLTTTISESTSITLSMEKSTTAAAQAMMPPTNIPITDSPTTRPPMTKTPPSMVLPTTLTTTISESTAITLTPPRPNDKAVACATHGELVCLDDGVFGLCNWGWAVPQRVADGTQCKEGKIVKRGGEEDYEYEWKGRKTQARPVRVRQDEDGMVWVPMEGAHQVETQ